MIPDMRLRNTKDCKNIDYQALQSLHTVKNELIPDSEGDILLQDIRLIIPGALPLCIIELAHESHQGITKNNALLHSKVWFLNIG